jgi:hypothetical protein
VDAALYPAIYNESQRYFVYLAIETKPSQQSLLGVVPLSLDFNDKSRFVDSLGRGAFNGRTFSILSAIISLRSGMWKLYASSRQIGWRYFVRVIPLDNQPFVAFIRTRPVL